MEQQPGHGAGSGSSGGTEAAGSSGGSNAAGSSGGSNAASAWLGATARVEMTVTDADTAQAMGSGDVPVLGTPRVLALAEAATVAATATKLPPGATTVGTRVELDHRAAIAVGRTVVAEARLAKVDGRKLMFEVTVRSGGDVVADGRVERALVDRHRFVERAFEA